MGYPLIVEHNKHIISNCTGQFIRHHTIEKGMTKASAEVALMQNMADLIQKTLLKNQGHHWIPDHRFWFWENWSPGRA